MLSRSATARQRVSSFTSITPTAVGWINAHQPLDLVPGHLAASTKLGISPIAILLPAPILRGCSGAHLAAQALSFLSSVPGIAFLPLLQVYAQVPALDWPVAVIDRHLVPAALGYLCRWLVLRCIALETNVAVTYSPCSCAASIHVRREVQLEIRFECPRSNRVRPQCLIELS